MCVCLLVVSPATVSSTRAGGGRGWATGFVSRKKKKKKMNERMTNYYQQDVFTLLNEKNQH